MSYDKKAIKDFADRWKDRGYEKGETQQFWLQILRLIDYPHVDEVLFEHHLPSGGYIDVWIREANVLIEQKSFGIDLDKPEERQGKQKTPLVQALDYIDELPRLEQPRYVMTCNFGVFRVYDRDQFGRSQIADHPFEFTLEELSEHPEYLSFINDPANSRLEKQKQVSIQAGKLIGQLYDKMRLGYINPDSDNSKHALNVLCVRLVFCLYCEDADLFEKNAFYNYLKDVPANRFRIALKQLFRALDTKIADRDPYETDVKRFPYVNGGLFQEETEVPNFTEDMKQFLLEEVSRPVDWSQISPTIFGGIFEGTLNPVTRRTGGMHYTTPENIHKVIDPLFLDGLKAEFAAIREEEGITPRKRKNALARFHDKLCSLKFFDPACGSGNFLTETYICLRKLEDAVLRELRQGQMGFGFGDDETDKGKRVSLSQFYGIEINDFAVSVAETALWISRLKANGEEEMLYEVGNDDFPLNDRANIIHENALGIDWNSVLSASECSFIMGNPPFAGHQYRTKPQQDDMKAVFAGLDRTGKLDYVACWYEKSALYMKGTGIKAAFVSPNAITQGEQVEPLWKHLLESGLSIIFAIRTFKWSNEASDQALVYCVIIGFSYLSCERKTLVNEAGKVAYPQNINGYLLSAPNVYIQSRGKPLFGGEGIMSKGSQPTDGGYLLLSEEEYDELIQKYPIMMKYTRQFMASEDFLKNKKRYCLWLVDSDPNDYMNIPDIQQRLNGVKQSRLASPTLSVQKDAEKPHVFSQIRQPQSNFLAVPEVTSGRRLYLPIGFLTPDIVVSNKLYLVPDASLYTFGVLSSLFHNAWMRVVASKYGPSYSYAPAVYNNFVWPAPSDEQKRIIEFCAQQVLDARALHGVNSLAEMYDGISPLPDDPSQADLKKYNLRIYDDLRDAHRTLDKAVEDAYGVAFNGDEEKIVAHLFKLYAEKSKTVYS